MKDGDIMRIWCVEAISYNPETDSDICQKKWRHVYSFATREAARRAARSFTQTALSISGSTNCYRVHSHPRRLWRDQIVLHYFHM